MNRRKNTNINKGAAFLLSVFMLLFFALIARFGYIEMTKHVDGKGLVALAKEKWTRKTDLNGQRGTIYDSKGLPLAENVPAYTVEAILSKTAKPDYVKHPGKTAAKLAPILHMSQSHLQDLLSRNAFQVELGPGGRRISYKEMEKIKSLHLKGIQFKKESKRFYPNQEFASYAVGYASRDPKTDKLKGDMGIEEEFNKQLTGSNGSMTYMSSSNGTSLPGTTKNVHAAKNGDNVYLTLDSHIQMFLEHAIDNVNSQYHPKHIMGIVMDPKTGKVLAMANRPSFNPNTRNIKNYYDDIISDPFEPGSVMKIFTLSAAVDAGVFNGNATYMSGHLTIGPNTIHDWNWSGWGRIDFNQAIQRSSNVGFAILAKKYIGFDRFYQYLQKFGFKQKTGIDLPNEANSKFAYHYPIEKATTAFGQGTAVTAMQLVKGATAVANNGKMMKPYIVDKVVDPNTGKVVEQTKPKVVGHPISAASAKKVRDLLRQVITGKHGTGKNYAIPGYKVVGKTGTAQIPDPKTGGYMAGPKYVYSFMGMAPMNDPQLLVYVAVDRPDVKTMFAGDAPVEKIFKFTMQHSLQYLNIHPDQSQGGKPAEKSVKLQDYTGQSAVKAKSALENRGLRTEVLGSGGTVQGQMPFGGESVLSGAKVFLKTGGTVKMPDLKGWSLGDVNKLADLLGLQPVVKGKGYVVEQSIAPGKTIKSGDPLSVTLGAPDAAGNGSQNKK